jgi:hypothetical protein
MIEDYQKECWVWSWNGLNVGGKMPPLSAIKWFSFGGAIEHLKLSFKHIKRDIPLDELCIFKLARGYVILKKIPLRQALRFQKLNQL